MKNLYREVFDEVRASGKLRQEVWNMTKQERSAPERRRIPAAALIAAVLVVILSGTAIAAAGVPGTLKGWFSRQWTEISGNSMSAEQLALIDKLTQPVGVSDTCDGVTVTVDSITSGDSSLWLLLKISGDMEFHEEAEPYYFGGVDWCFTPDLDSEMAPGGYGTDHAFSGLTEDGVLTMLMRYTATLTGRIPFWRAVIWSCTCMTWCTAAP